MGKGLTVPSREPFPRSRLGPSGLDPGCAVEKTSFKKALLSVSLSIDPSLYLGYLSTYLPTYVCLSVCLSIYVVYKPDQYVVG